MTSQFPNYIPIQNLPKEVEVEGQVKPTESMSETVIVTVT